jgi:hypothetical protein
METPVAEKAPAKTEAELIATVANIQDAESSLLFAQRAIKAGMPALAAACEERAKALTPIKSPRAKKPQPIKVAKVNPDQAGAPRQDVGSSADCHPEMAV